MIAPATTNSGCSPPGMPTRFSTATSPKPKPRPKTPPTSASSPSSSARSQPAMLPPAMMYSVSTMTRKTAIGSLVPDSISSIACTRCCSRSPPVRSRKNTAAASVGAMIEPSSSEPTGSRSSTAQAASPATEAVISTPTVTSSIDGAQHAAEHRQPGAQPAVEQDHRQRDRADEIGDGYSR